MAEDTIPRWKFLTNHAQVLVCIAHDPGVLLREISAQVGITERAAHRIVTELAGSGYIKRERNGRRNQYTVQSTVALPDRLGRVERISDLLTILTGPQA
jgi:predicted transcriptional regulator